MINPLQQKKIHIKRIYSGQCKELIMVFVLKCIETLWKKEKLLVTSIFISLIFSKIFSFREINFLPNDKLLGWTKLKTFADDKSDSKI